MRTTEIESGKTYRVHLSERDSLVYRGCEVDARVVRAGFHREVETVTGSRVRGAPFHRYHTSEHPDGVEVEWDAQEVWSNRRHFDKEPVHAGRAIVASRNVRYECEDA